MNHDKNTAERLEEATRRVSDLLTLSELGFGVTPEAIHEAALVHLGPDAAAFAALNRPGFPGELVT